VRTVSPEEDRAILAGRRKRELKRDCHDLVNRKKLPIHDIDNYKKRVTKFVKAINFENEKE